jgi:tetratricopeptide (TPR) repeat protein
LEGAKNRFEEAMRIDPTFESPYMNLAELAAHNGDIQSAIQLYAKAKELAPDRGLIYVRLGELYIEGTGDIASAKKIWEQGLKNTADDEKKNELRDLLKQIPAGQ